jgi:hypothetical protein
VATVRTTDIEFTDTTPSIVSGTFGSAGITYGQVGWTYGQSASDQIASVYQPQPYPGGTNQPGWEYRQFDTLPAFKVSLRSPSGLGAINYATIVAAELVLHNNSYGSSFEWNRKYPLTVGADSLFRNWSPFDLNVVGEYRAVINVTFNTGRTLAVQADNGTLFIVRDGGTT